MDDYIPRETALELLKHIEYKESSINAAGAMIMALQDIPAADVRPVVRGEWVESIEECGWNMVVCVSCSVCGDSYILDDWGLNDIKELWNFCPNCGAEMR